MAYYELKALKRGYPPSAFLPDVRPASEREAGSGSELFEAKDDDEAAARGKRAQARLGDGYIVSVYDNSDMQRRMVYPTKGPSAQEA
jgi:hypothetical protein